MSKRRATLAAGIAAFCTFVFLSAACGPEASSESTPAITPSSVSTAAASSTARTSAAIATPAAPGQTSTAVPRSAVTSTPQSTSYTVKSGDTIGAICAQLVPAMGTVACTQAVVELNKLGGADQLSVGQALLLPGNTTSASTQPGATQRPSANPTSLPPQATATSAPLGLLAAATATTASASVQPTTAPSPIVQTAPTATAQVGCHPSYSGGTDIATGGCIRIGVGDYDCYPGNGDGPNYVRGPLTVIGPDEFKLDTNDADDIACEPAR